MTEAEYWRIYEVIKGEVQTAIRSNHAYLTIHNLAAAETDIFNEMNRFPEFWTLNTLALQTTFFIVFGRLFDRRRDVYSVHKLVDATIKNPAFFSKTALRERKIKSQTDGTEPSWLANYLRQAREPTSADLLSLKTALAPHYGRFKAIYEPLRHQYFAHRGIQSDAAISALFERALISDVNEILRFLDTLILAIYDVAWNGRLIDLSNHGHYDSFVQDIRGKTESFIRRPRGFPKPKRD